VRNRNVTCTIPVTSPVSRIYSAARTRGSWLAADSFDGTVRIWDTAKGQEWATLTGHAYKVHVMAVAPDRGAVAWRHRHHDCGYAARNGQPGDVRLSNDAGAFDGAVTAPLGDYNLTAIHPTATPKMTVLQPGHSIVIPVTITPSGPARSVVCGTLYVDALVGGSARPPVSCPPGRSPASRWPRCRTSTPSADPAQAFGTVISPSGRGWPCLTTQISATSFTGWPVTEAMVR
jgi:WD40 repeat protein